MTMGSRRSSDGDTSADDLDMKNSISLEFDDYPLDLVSPLCKEDLAEQDLLAHTDWIMPSDTLDFAGVGGDSTEAYLTDETFKFINERDRFLTDEIITDFGKRKSGEYTTTAAAATADGDLSEVFVKVHDLHPLHHRQSNGVCRHGDSGDRGNGGEPQGPNCCQRLRARLTSCCRLCLSRYYTAPASPSWYDRWRYALLCPPHGWLSHLMAMVLFTLILWGLLWTVDEDGASFGGGMFALLAMTVCSHTAGRLVECIRFPPLLGMVLVGCVVINVEALNFTQSLGPRVIDILRELGLASLLVRSGLSLTPRSLRLQCPAVFRLAVLPAVTEALTVGLLARLILDMPWLWAFFAGCLLSVCGPGVANPTVLSLQAQGYGLDKNIPSLLVAATAADSIIPLTAASVILSILLNHAPLVLTIFRGPLEAMGGVIVALVLGSTLWYIPHKQHPQLTLLRVALLGGGGCLLSLGSWAVRCPRVMPLGLVTLVFVTVNRWRKDQHKFCEKSVLEEVLRNQWYIMQPLFYSVLGLHADVSHIRRPLVGPSIAVILLGCMARLAMTFLATFRTSLNHKEKIFVSLAWLPRSTVQLTLGSLALLTARDSDADPLTQEWANVVWSVSTLCVLVTLPLGGIMTTVSASYLLSHASHLINAGEAEKVDLDWEENIDFNPQLSKLRISEISNVTQEVEITAERETVT